MLSKWEAVSTLDRMFDDVMGSMLGTATSARTFAPAIDVRTNNQEVVVVCDVPGVKQEDLEVTLENRILTVRGTRKFESREDEQVVLGRAYGSFERSFELPEYIDGDNLAAHLADGVLTIRIPKQAKARARKIQIGSGTDSKQLQE